MCRSAARKKKPVVALREAAKFHLAFPVLFLRMCLSADAPATAVAERFLSALPSLADLPLPCGHHYCWTIGKPTQTQGVERRQWSILRNTSIRTSEILHRVQLARVACTCFLEFRLDAFHHRLRNAPFWMLPRDMSDHIVDLWESFHE